MLCCACEAGAFEQASPGTSAAPSVPQANTGPERQVGDTPGTAAEPAALTPTEVESVEDVPGTYYRPFALPGQISYVSLGPLEMGEGDYTLFRSCGTPLCVAESGRYRAVPINLAIGYAFVSFRPEASESQEVYVLDRIWRDRHDRVVSLQLRRLLEHGPGGFPIPWVRIPEPEEEDIAAGPAPQTPPAAMAAGEADEPGDLPGVYVRALPTPGEAAALTLESITWSDGVGTGWYREARPYCLPWCLPRLGTFEVELFDVYLGTGRLTLQPNAGTGNRTYVIDAIWRTPTGSLSALQLQRVHDGGLVGAPFLMYRQWWDGPESEERSVLELASGLTADELVEVGDLEPEVAEALVSGRDVGPYRSTGEVDRAASAGAQALAGPGLCAYYRGLEDYYRTRALQCAYSACWPMSSWYTYWANHYGQKAEEACSEPE